MNRISWYANRNGMVRREWINKIRWNDSDVIPFSDAAKILEKFENESRENADRLTEKEK